MKKPAWLLATALIVAMSFTACGHPSSTDKVKTNDTPAFFKMTVPFLLNTFK